MYAATSIYMSSAQRRCSQLSQTLRTRMPTLILVKKKQTTKIVFFVFSVRVFGSSRLENFASVTMFLLLRAVLQ